MTYAERRTPIFPTDDTSRDIESPFRDMEQKERFGEEVVKITRHRTVSSDQEDDSNGPSHQCCLCGMQTLERCLKCNWAAYCSSSCYSLHRPVHQFFCTPRYAEMFPRLTGLQVIPLAQAVRKLNLPATVGESPIGIPTSVSSALSGRDGAFDGKCNDVRLLNANVLRNQELALIQRRARLIRNYLRESGGRPACAICGDTCRHPHMHTPHPPAQSPTRQETCASKVGGDPASAMVTRECSSGDSDWKAAREEMPQRLVRFGGMLLCTTCVEIQAAEV